MGIASVGARLGGILSPLVLLLVRLCSYRMNDCVQIFFHGCKNILHGFKANA